MLQGQIIICRLSSATDIAMHLGEHLLIGRPVVFGSEFRDMIVDHELVLMKRLLQAIWRFSSNANTGLTQMSLRQILIPHFLSCSKFINANEPHLMGAAIAASHLQKQGA